MRVFHITNFLPHSHNTWGGAEVACMNIIKLLAQDNTISQAVGATLPQNEVKGPFTFFPIETVSERYPAPYFYFMRHFWLQKDTIVKSQIKNAIQMFRPDLVHFHNFSILTFSALHAVKEARIPALLSIYDYWIDCPTNMLLDLENNICQSGHGRHCINRCLHSQFFRWSHYFCNLPVMFRKGYFSRQVALFDRIIALSENSKEVLKRHGDSLPEIEVIRLASDIKITARQAGGAGAPRLLFAGWVQARKGPDIVVKAMAEVVKKFPSAILDVVGPLSESTYEAYIRNLVAELGLEKNINITGKLPEDEFRRKFDMADIVVVAEQWENMSPLFMVESMAAGKTIVSGRIGGIPEFIRHNKDGLLARHDDPADFADKINDLLSDKEKAEAMGKSAQERAIILCDKKTIKKELTDLYGKIIAEHDRV